MELSYPNPDVLTERCRAGSSVLISAPFYSAVGLDWIAPSTGRPLEFWTRLNPFDWAAGFSDPIALYALINRLEESRCTICVHRALHAKLYLTDQWGMVGSANLTSAAFSTNIELMCELTREEEISALRERVEALRSQLTELSLENLRAFIDVTRDAVVRHQETGEIEVSTDMQAAVDLADELLIGPTHEATSVPDLEAFITFLGSQPGEAARELIERHEGKNNLQGHVKQSYFGAVQFLRVPRNADLLRQLARVAPNGMPRYDEDFMRRWIDFLDRNAEKLEDEGYSLSILRRILPESWGGYTVSGGGGSSTLKRILPYVARFLG